MIYPGRKIEPDPLNGGHAEIARHTIRNTLKLRQRIIRIVEAITVIVQTPTSKLMDDESSDTDDEESPDTDGEAEADWTCRECQTWNRPLTLACVSCETARTLPT
jgi:hypothetical protein